MEEFLEMLAMSQTTYVYVFRTSMRYIIPVMLLLLMLRCLRPLLAFRREPEIWAWLCIKDGKKLPITHWENIIGRGKSSDVRIDFPTISRNHAVLTRYDDGSWTITDADSKDGVRVNGKTVKISALSPEDVISIGGIEMTLQPISRRQEIRLAQLRTKAGTVMDGIANLLLLTAIQFLSCTGFLLGGNPGEGMFIVIGYAGITITQWILFIFYACIHRTSFEVETIAFYLCSMGMAAIATVAPQEAVKQLIALEMGIVMFLVIGWALRDLERVKKIRYLAAAAGIALLLITLVFGKEYHGAKNWLEIGPFSVQPSEISKVCFVFTGASAMDRLLNKRNLILFIIYTIFLCGCLALMNDFGTALIFFVAFLVIAYLRSGNVGTIALACTSLGFAGVIALKIAPHVLRRFSIWHHIWEDPLDRGYQQTRAMMCIASGGVLGLGAGQGWMKNVFAADSDMVFATISEEWGLLTGFLMVLCIAALALFAVRSASVGRSSFYVIGACTAASILVVQVILNALGTVDILPLTGVTFPFVSNGGSSMIGAWGLLAFVKASDTRQNASFAVRLSQNGGAEDE